VPRVLAQLGALPFFVTFRIWQVCCLFPCVCAAIWLFSCSSVLQSTLNPSDQRKTCTLLMVVDYYVLAIGACPFLVLSSSLHSGGLALQFANSVGRLPKTAERGDEPPRFCEWSAHTLNNSDFCEDELLSIRYLSWTVSLVCMNSHVGN